MLLSFNPKYENSWRKTCLMLHLFYLGEAGGHHLQFRDELFYRLIIFIQIPDEMAQILANWKRRLFNCFYLGQRALALLSKAWVLESIIYNFG